MTRIPGRRWKAIAAPAASLCIGLIAAASVAMYGQEQSAVYVFAVDDKGVPVLDLEPKVGHSRSPCWSTTAHEPSTPWYTTARV